MTQLGPPDPTQAAYERGFRDGARFGRDPWPDVLADPGARAALDAGLADVAAGRVKPFTPWMHITNRPEVATQAARYLGGRLDMRDVRSFLAGVTVTALVTVAALLFVGPASAHDITSANVSCAAQTITITGTNFDIPANSPVTVSRQGGGYSQTFPVTTADWTQVLGPIAPSSLIPNGVFDVTWPGAGTHAITFQIFCARSEPTPTPVVTPAPTPTPTQPTVTPQPSPVVTPSPVITPRLTPEPTLPPVTPTIPNVTMPPTDSE